MTTATKHRLVALDAWLKVPPLDFDCEITQYPNSKQEEIPERIKDATIVVISGTPLGREAIQNAPHLQLVASNGVGTNHIDKQALQEQGASLCFVPGQNTESVSEHAFALYFALNRQVIEMHNLVLESTIWPKEVTVHKEFGCTPRTVREETLVVVGYGALGRNVERIGKALGMKTIIADRKGAETVREGRVPFNEAVEQGTVFILTAPYDESTHNMFGTPEFEAMDSTALIVNVGRGGIINEKQLVKALREKKIGGAAVDVFEHEPATKSNSVLLEPGIPRLVLSPHIAWFSSRTIKGTIATVQANLNAFAAGRPQNIVIAGKGCPKP